MKYLGSIAGINGTYFLPPSYADSFCDIAGVMASDKGALSPTRPWSYLASRL